MTTPHFDSASQASEQRYRHLFVHVPICIFVADLAVTPVSILEVNRRAELVYGYTAAELVGLPAIRLVPDDARPTVLAIAQRVQQGETVTAETTNQRRDGTSFPVRCHRRLIRTDASHMIVTVEDISAERGAAVRLKPSTPSAAASPTRSTTVWRKAWPGCASSRRFWQQRAAAAPPGMAAALDELHDVLTTTIVDLRRAISRPAPGGPGRAGLLPCAGPVGRRLRRPEPTGGPAGGNWPARYPTRSLRITSVPHYPGEPQQRRPARRCEFSVGASGGGYDWRRSQSRRR